MPVVRVDPAVGSDPFSALQELDRFSRGTDLHDILHELSVFIRTKGKRFLNLLLSRFKHTSPAAIHFGKRLVVGGVQFCLQHTVELMEAEAHVARCFAVI